MNKLLASILAVAAAGAVQAADVLALQGQGSVRGLPSG
jgi:opacity protein-like surface antigen